MIILILLTATSTFIKTTLTLRCILKITALSRPYVGQLIFIRFITANRRRKLTLFVAHYGLTFSVSSVTSMLKLTLKVFEVRDWRYLRAEMTLQLCIYAIVFITAEIIILLALTSLTVKLTLNSSKINLSFIVKITTQ